MNTKIRYYFGSGTVVLANRDKVPECWTVYSDEGNRYRWWEYPLTKSGFEQAIATAKAIAVGEEPDPIEEMAR